jgi:sulfur oxidation c-type cytochrome SoxX
VVRALVAGMTTCLVLLPCLAANLPRDAAINPSAPVRTLAPRVVVNSGRLDWVPNKRDLTAWPTLSYQDRTPTPKPRRAKLDPPLNGDPGRGRGIAFAVDRGNCITCHHLPGDEWPGSLGPAMAQYGSQGKTDAWTYQQVYDPRVHNPASVMPPFGTFGLLTDQDIRDLVAYLQSLK